MAAASLRSKMFSTAAVSQARACLRNSALLRRSFANLSSPSELSQARNDNAVVVDIRSHQERKYALVRRALHCEWNRDAENMPVELLPQDKSKPIILYCRSGRRVDKARVFLEEIGYEKVLNGGGPVTQEQWEAFCY